jgi:putative thioredoxin
LGPVLDKLAAGDQRFELVKVNVDLVPEVSQRYRIASIPAVKLFKDGKVLAEFVGALPERQIARSLDEHLPNELTLALREAQAARRKGELPAAKAALERALALDPKNSEARVGLAELTFPERGAAVLDLVRDIDERDPNFEGVQAVQTLAALLPLADAPAANDDDQRVYQEGARALRAGNYSAAFDTWIDLLRRHRKLDDDGPKRACLALFRVLGDDHALVREYRRVFASALF